MSTAGEGCRHQDRSGPLPAPRAALKHAIARQEGWVSPGRLEMRDLGGGTSPGEAGLEVAPRSSEGPQRMLEGDWEGRADTSSTWRTFPCTQQPQLQGIPFPPLLGRLGLGLEMGRLRWVTRLTKQAWVWGPGAETALFSALGTGESPAAGQRKHLALLHPTNT